MADGESAVRRTCKFCRDAAEVTVTGASATGTHSVAFSALKCPVCAAVDLAVKEEREACIKEIQRCRDALGIIHGQDETEWLAADELIHWILWRGTKGATT